MKNFFILTLILVPILLFAQDENSCEIELDRLNSDLFLKYFSNCDSSESSFYLTGEQHHSNSTNSITLEFIKYLILEKGLDYIFLEAGISFSECLNQYILNGDEEYLESTLKSYNRNHQSYYELYRGIREIVVQNDYETKFIGIDVEYSLGGALNSILINHGDNLLEKEKLKLKRIQEKGLSKKTTKKEFYKTVEEISNRLKLQEKGKSSIVVKIISGIYNYKKNWMKRDQLMYKSIKYYYEEQNNKVGYLSVGIQHMKKNNKVLKNIRYYLTEFLGRENTFISMINYHDCKNIDGSKHQTIDKNSITSKRYGLKKSNEDFNMWINVNSIN